MKLLKKLMPVATVAATAACVVPMVTSCTSAIVSTSDLNFKPDQLAGKEYTKMEDAEKDYLTPTNVANDILYTAVTLLDGIESTISSQFSDWFFNFNFAINEINIGTERKHIDFEYERQQYKADGYFFNGKVSLEYKYGGYVKSAPSKAVKYLHYTQTIKSVFEFKDFFISLNYSGSGTGQNWYSMFFGAKAISENMSLKCINSTEIATKTKYADNKIETTNQANDEVNWASAKAGREFIQLYLKDPTGSTIKFNNWFCHVFDKSTYKAK